MAAELLAAAAPETSDDEAAKKRAAQRLSLSETLDGMWRLDGWLDPEAGLIVSAAIASFTRKPDPDGDVLTESAPHRRAEALVQLARHAVAHAEDCNGQGGNRATLILGLSHPSLVDGLGTAGTPDGKRLPAAAARRMACDAGIIPAVYGSDSQILDFGRLTRTIPAGLRRYIIARDGGCVFPGCDRPPAWTEIHHREHWVETKAKPNPKTSRRSAFTTITSAMKAAGNITIGNDQDRTPWFYPPDGRPPLQANAAPSSAPLPTHHDGDESVGRLKAPWQGSQRAIARADSRGQPALRGALVKPRSCRKGRQHSTTLGSDRSFEKWRTGDMALRRFRDLDTAGRALRVRNLAIGNSVAGVVVSLAAFAFLPTGIAVGISALMALGVADWWYLQRRYQKTGRLLR